MNKKLTKLIVLFFAFSMFLCIPSSYAKYSMSTSFSVPIRVENSSSIYYTTDMSKKEITLAKIGRYLIIAKGGDGANGYTYHEDLYGGYSDYHIEGGIGGTVAGVLTTTSANTKIYAYPGSAGVRPKKEDASTSTYGAGGTNSAGFGSGGRGHYFVSIAAGFSNELSSGGGGAATIVCLGSEYNSSNKSNVIMVAGGGGAAGVWSRKYKNSSYFKTQVSGTGGNGGSNIASGLKGTVYNGSNASEIADGKKHTNGYGGTTSGGAGGSTNWVVRCALSPYNGGTGSTFAKNGTGGNGDCYGGGGGGGYCGGGGGAGTSIDIAAGGGGGGSSYVASSLTSFTSSDYSKAMTEVAKLSPTIPTQYSTGQGYGDSGNNGSAGADGNGYVIAYYLGP